MTVIKKIHYAGQLQDVEFESEEAFQVYLRQKEDTSHRDFFSKGDKQYVATQAPSGEIRDVKQAMRQAELIEGYVQKNFVRAPAGSSVNVETISFEQWSKLQADYQAAIAAGESHPDALERVGYQPLSVYIHKIVREGKKDIRPILQHEVGVRPNGKILVLADRFPGDVGSVVVGPHTFKGK